jgi:hypothetical protein
MKKLIMLNLAFVVATLTAGSAVAQKETSTGVAIDQDIELMRRDLRSEKKQIIAANVPLTDAEATKFWVVYDQYAAEMTKHNSDFYAVIKDYAANQKTLTDAQANDMIKRWTAIQVELAQTRQKYMPLFAKVVPGKKVALFAQIDRRLYALMDLQVASAVPLVLQ